MPDNCIVTIRTEDGAFEVDLDIPSRIPFGEFKGDLLGILKTLSEDAFGGWNDCALQCKAHVFGEKDTLMDMGAFDGSILVISRG